MKALPQLLDKDTAFSSLVEGIKDVLVESNKIAYTVTIEGWYEVGCLVNQFIKVYETENINQFCLTVGQEVSKELGYRISRASYYNAVRFANKLDEDGLSVEEAIQKYGTWRRIIIHYLPEGGGCNTTPSDSGPTDTNILPPSPPSSKSPYEDCLTLPCPICGKKPVVKAHYPTTRGAGAADDEWIPLCQECHDEQHRGFETWTIKYIRKLFKDFIYPIMRREK